MSAGDQDDSIRAELIRDTLLAPALQEIERVRGTVAEVRDVVAEARDAVQAVEQQNVQLVDQLQAIGDAEGFTSPIVREEFPYNLSVEVPANTPESDPVTVTREAPSDVRVKDISVVATSAADQRVGAQVRAASGERWVPRDPQADAQYVPLDDNPVEATINVELQQGEEFQARYANNSTEDRFVRTIVVLQELI
jgi:hypothetical protein